MTGALPPLNLYTFTGWTPKDLSFFKDGNIGLSENEETSKKAFCRICYQPTRTGVRTLAAV
jgi:hypothetical protein